MAQPLSLQLYVLRHSEVEQAAWVRANTLTDATAALFDKSRISIVVSNDYGWVLFPDERQFTDKKKRPLPHWEFLAYMRGPADLKCIPKYIKVLTEKRAPRRYGKVVIGREFARTTPLDLRSMPVRPVIGRPQVCHSGYREPYTIRARQLLGPIKNPDAITIGKTALLELMPEEEARHVEAGDTIRIGMKREQDDHYLWIVGQITHKSVLLNILAIETS